MGDRTTPSKVIPVRTTYLEMRSCPEYIDEAPPESCLVMRAIDPTVGFYKFLYGTVGKEWGWVDRLMMEESRLKEIISDPLIEIHVLYMNGVPAGYAELDRRSPNDVELAYFGLMREFIGKGLGKYLLRWAVQKAWGVGTDRVWVHTCELDHPAALPNYLKAGFVIYKEGVVQQPLLDM